MVNDFSKWQIERGEPYPFGTTPTPDGVNFALASKYASAVTLCVYNSDGSELLGSLTLDSVRHRTGDVWHAHVRGLTPPFAYGYRCDGPKGRRHRFDPHVVLLDPYAKALLSIAPWGKPSTPLLGVVLPTVPYDWEGDQPLNRPLKELIIYEAHIRGFTQHPSSGVTDAGTYESFCAKIPHLVDLGITAVELLPVYAFNECDSFFQDPATGKPLLNVWGYSPLSFFAPMPRYASSQAAEASLLGFKKLVKELHKVGIEVILDVVYNHPGEGGYSAVPLSLKGIDHASYYHLDAVGNALDFTGCSNSLNGNTAFTKELIINSLRYWVTEMHVDGFRFDLASVLNRGRYGRPLANSPLIDMLSQDPILAHTKLIAEPWDAAGMYQVGAFYSQEDRWCEWNGKYRDTLRLFINGQGSSHSEFATRLCGSQDLYGHFRKPTSSINFIIAHDGFTLHDLVTYSQKHNEVNGENNRDGTNDNYSWNCGAEGPSDDPAVVQLREQQKRNFVVALFVSQGIPMFLMGDEYGHTKNGNNNSYNQDNALNWFLWDELAANSSFYRFFSGLIALRKQHSQLLQRSTFLTPEDIAWYNAEGATLEWDHPDRFIAFTLFDHAANHHLYIAFNARADNATIHLPMPPPDFAWNRLVDTAQPSPQDYCEEADALTITTDMYTMPAHTALILKAF